jgi:hypothetical protein
MFERRDLARLGRAVRATEKVTHLSGPEQYRRGQIVSPILYGKVATTYSPGSATVSLTPVKSSTDATATGADNVAVQIYADFTMPKIPAQLNASVGDILAYVAIAPVNSETPNFSLLSPPILNRGTAAYQVFQMDSTGTVGIWDWPRLH